MSLPTRLSRTIVCTAVVVAAAAGRGGERPVVGLDEPMQATWEGVPLRAWADRATTLAGRPVILDRRIDPGILVTLTARGEPLRDVLATVAARAGAAVEVLAGTVRIVPASLTGRAAAAEADRDRRISRLPAAARSTLADHRPWRWPAGARPRDLAAAAAAEAGLEVDGLESLPHDHFPAADLLPLSLAERLDLLLAHFDRRVLWERAGSGARGRIVAIDAEIEPGPAAVARPADRPRPRPGGGTRAEFTLRLEAPLDTALAGICDSLGLTLDLDTVGLAARGIAPGTIVRASVEKVSRAELLDAVLHPAGLAWKIESDRLRVFPAEPPSTP